MLNVPKHGYDIKVGMGVWIGSRPVILGPCSIGDHAVIAAGPIVTEDVPSLMVVAGVPAKPIRRYQIGLRPSALSLCKNKSVLFD